MCASDQVNQAETMASKEQSVILKKARLTEHPLRLSPQPATKQQSAMHLKPLVSPSATSRPHPRMATCPFLSLSLAPPSTPPATLLTSFRFGPRQEDLADVPSGFWEKGLFQVCPPPPAPPPISPSSPPGAAPLLCTSRCFLPADPVRNLNTETRPRSRVPIRSLSKWPTSCRPPRRPVGTASCARFVGSRPLPLSHLLHGRIGHLLPALATRSPRRHLPAPPSWQDHGVFAQHNKFGTFEVPKTFLNNDKEAAECAAEVAEKQAAKKAVKQSKTKQKTKKEASAEQAKAVPSKAVRATPSKATVAVHMSHVMALLPTGRPACSHGPGRTSANDEPPVPMRAPPHLDPLRLGARDALLWAMLWALVAIGRRAGA